MKNSKVKFHKGSLRKELRDNLILQQTELLIKYAKEKIVEIGNEIMSFDSKNHMDEHGNLLDSLCWGVLYNGVKKGYGFFRESVASQKSMLHEWSPQIAVDIDGRSLASKFVKSYKGNGEKGWNVFFATLAPYWGYWEKGFKMKSHFGAGMSGVSGTFQFSVMTFAYDQIRQDLQPASVSFDVYVPKYTNFIM